MASSPGNPSIMPNSTASRFKHRSSKSRKTLSHKSARSPSPISKGKTSKRSFSWRAPKAAQNLWRLTCPFRRTQRLAPVYVEKLVALAFERAPAPGFQLRYGPRHNARDLLGIVLAPQVFLRDPV